jgi:hypothetical protein
MFDHERSKLGGALRTLGEVFAQPQFGGPGGVVKLTRYETALQRLLTSSMRELRQAQAKRNAEHPFRMGADGQAPATRMLMGTERDSAEEQQEERRVEGPIPQADAHGDARSTSPAPSAGQDPDFVPEQSTARRKVEISKRTPPLLVDEEAPWPGPASSTSAEPVWRPAATPKEW